MRYVRIARWGDCEVDRMRELNQAETDELNYILQVKDRTDKEYAKRIKEIGEEAEAIISGEWYRQMKGEQE